MYEDIKWIANAYRIKCSKYKPEELTPGLCDTLFDEAYNEYTMMQIINATSIDGVRGTEQ